MGLKITDDKKVWDDFLSCFKSENQDIYFTYEYYNLYIENNSAKALAAIFEGESGMKLLYPFVMTPIRNYKIAEGYYDIESAYGYGGPIVENYNEEDSAKFEEAFLTWCKENKIVGEFIRFHPLINNHAIFKKNITVECNRATVYVDLSSGAENIWNYQFKSENRTRIRKAIKAGVEIEETQDFKSFIKLYYSTMDRLQADKFYYFSEIYFDKLSRINEKNLTLLNAVYNNEVIASAIFFGYGRYMHYHLGCSNSAYLKYAPNNLLMFSAIESGCKKGYDFFHMGGGTTSDPDDSLLRYKSSFSKNKSEFYIGKRVHNSELYKRLIDEWSIRNKSKPKIFLQYD